MPHLEYKTLSQPKSSKSKLWMESQFAPNNGSALGFIFYPNLFTVSDDERPLKLFLLESLYVCTMLSLMKFPWRISFPENLHSLVENYASWNVISSLTICTKSKFSWWHCDILSKSWPWSSMGVKTAHRPYFGQFR